VGLRLISAIGCFLTLGHRALAPPTAVEPDGSAVVVMPMASHLGAPERLMTWLLAEAILWLAKACRGTIVVADVATVGHALDAPLRPNATSTVVLVLTQSGLGPGRYAA